MFSILILSFSLLPVSAETTSKSPTTYKYYFYNNLNGKPVFDKVYLCVCRGTPYQMKQDPDYEHVYYLESNINFSNTCIFITNSDKYFDSKTVAFNGTPNLIWVPTGKSSFIEINRIDFDSFKSTLPSPLEYHFSKSISSLSNNIFNSFYILIPVGISIFASLLGIILVVRLIRRYY